MTGKVTKYNPNTKTGYICNITNGLSCMFKESDVKGDDIANGYIVDFYLAYDEELQRICWQQEQKNKKKVKMLI